MPTPIRSRLKTYIQGALGRQRRPPELQKAMPAVSGRSSLGVASVQPPAPARRVYGQRDIETVESEPLSDEEQAILDRSKGKGRHARQAAEVYAQQYRRQ